MVLEWLVGKGDIGRYVVLVDMVYVFDMICLEGCFVNVVFFFKVLEF